MSIERRKINLALQGGGSHGAFTWGVLDRLLEDERLEIDAVTGTSAGAMNAVALASGYLDGGREGARVSLARFWSSVCRERGMSSSQRDLFERFFGGWRFDGSPMHMWLDFMGRFASPYDFNPLNINPLRDHLARTIDFEKVRACERMKVFIAATNVHTGKIAIFDRAMLTPDHVMASACLPTIFQAVEIDGTPYWDGGYLGNPPIFPLFYHSKTPDIVLVQINPVLREETPRTARDIQNRLNEITFNAALMSEFRAIDFVTRLIDSGRLSQDDYMRPFMHRIHGAGDVAAYSAATKLDTRWRFLSKLRDIGRSAADAWLAAHFDDIGARSTMNLRIGYAGS